MANIPQGSELSKFTEEVATALFRAIDSRPTGTDDLLDRFGVTAGIWIDPKRPPRIPDFDRARIRPVLSPLAKSEVAALTTRAAVSRESVGRLNDAVGSDPSRSLRLLKSLASDPGTWDELFYLDDERRGSLKSVDAESLKAFQDFVDKLAAFGEDLTELTFDIAPRSAVAKAKPTALKGKWYVPDKFELSGTAKNGGYEVKGTLTWEF